MTMMVQTSTDEAPELLARSSSAAPTDSTVRRVVGGGVPDRDRPIP